MLDSIYFAKAEDGSIKIGRSTDIAQRQGNLRCLNGGKVRMLKVFEGVGKYERTVHRALAESALGQEWFEPTPKVLKMADARDGREMLAMIGVNSRSFDCDGAGVTDLDRDELETARRMMADAKKLRQRVQARIRKRKQRAKS